MTGRDTFSLWLQKCFVRDIIDKIKIIQDSKYEPETKTWSLPIAKKNEFLQSIDQICYDNDIQIEDVPDFVLTTTNQRVPFQTYKKKTVKHDYASDPQKYLDQLPESLSQKLYPFQK